MWSIVSGCGVPLKNPMIIASFVSAIASSDRNISFRSKFLVQNCALFSGSMTARLKCQTAPSCTFTSIPLRNASSPFSGAGLPVPLPYCYLTKSKVPTEVDLRLTNLVASKRENLGVAKPAAIGLLALVGHDDLIAMFDEALEIEGFNQLRVRPASLEVFRPVYPHVSGAVNCEVVGETLLYDAPVFGHVGAV